jgi:hypothetical protein
MGTMSIYNEKVMIVYMPLDIYIFEKKYELFDQE